MKFATLLPIFISCALGFPHLANFPEHRPLTGLSAEEVRAVARTFSNTPGPQPIPPPINDTRSKLVNDADHPFEPLRPGDIRGPCPGLNTLASHGYINRTGVTTPGEIITAVQEGFNLGHRFAGFLAYSAFLPDGNHLTNMMSIGRNTTVQGVSTSGVNTHNHFEGDASITRNDFALGNSFLFNKTLFDVLVHAAKEVGNGLVTFESAAYDRALRVNDSIARNPTFFYEIPRIIGATAESVFLLAMFVNGQTEDVALPLRLEDARSFFDSHKFPDGFFRRRGPFEFPQIISLTNKMIDMVGVQPGHNEGVNNYIVNSEDVETFCLFYQKQVNLTASLYPNPPPELEAAIKTNMNTYYEALGDPTCPQLFPYGM